MTVRPRKPCAHPGCRAWATCGSYCEVHAAEYAAQRAERRSAAMQRADRSRLSPDARGYNSRWNKARKTYLRHHPLCVVCGEPATEVDHIIPHKGDMQLFWDVSNWQSLCHSCHSRKTFSEVNEMKKRKPVSDDYMGIMIID